MAEIVDILDTLIERTRENKVLWKPTSSPQTFVAVIGNSSVMIVMDSGLATLRINNKAGDPLEVLDARTILGTPHRGPLNDLHRLARRQALEVDVQLDDLLKALENDSEPT